MAHRFVNLSLGDAEGWRRQTVFMTELSSGTLAKRGSNQLTQ